jgi:hypothetical protein
MGIAVTLLIRAVLCFMAQPLRADPRIDCYEGKGIEPAIRAVLSASKGRQTSFEEQQASGGLFSVAFERIVLRDRASNDSDGNGIISISELYSALKASVGQREWRAPDTMANAQSDGGRLGYVLRKKTKPQECLLMRLENRRGTHRPACR